MQMDFEPTIKELELRKEKLYIQHVIPKGLYIKKPTIVEDIYDDMVMTLAATVTADRAEEEMYIQYPHKLIDYLLDKLPIGIRIFEFLKPTYKIHTWKTNYIYPNLELPKDEEYTRMAITNYHSTIDKF